MGNITSDNQQWYSGAEIADKLGVTRQHVAYLRKMGRLQGMTVGKTTIYSEAHLAAYLAEEEVKAQARAAAEARANEQTEE